MQEMLDFIVAERPDQCGRKTEGDRLQHEAFGRLTGLHVDIAPPAVAMPERRMQTTAGALAIHSRPRAASTNFSRV
jgi:hypothetical protein